jgi:16S rRNA processing protein RimM
MFETRLVPVCRILHAHGTQGEVLVEPYLTDLTCYERLGEMALRMTSGTSQRFGLAHVRRAGERLLIQLDGVNSVEMAQALAGLEGYVKRGELPPPPEGDFYWFDLEGLTVYTEAGDYLGRIEEFFPTGSNAVLVVRNGMRETLLPFIRDVILAVDGARGTIQVRALPGLL